MTAREIHIKLDDDLKFSSQTAGDPYDRMGLKNAIIFKLTHLPTKKHVIRAWSKYAKSCDLKWMYNLLKRDLLEITLTNPEK